MKRWVLFGLPIPRAVCPCGTEKFDFPFLYDFLLRPLIEDVCKTQSTPRRPNERRGFGRKATIVKNRVNCGHGETNDQIPRAGRHDRRSSTATRTAVAQPDLPRWVLERKPLRKGHGDDSHLTFCSGQRQRMGYRKMKNLETARSFVVLVVSR